MADKIRHLSSSDRLRLTARNISAIIAIATLGTGLIDASLAYWDEIQIGHAIEMQYPVDGDIVQARATLNAAKWQTDRYLSEDQPNIPAVQTLMAAPSLQTPVAVSKQLSAQKDKKWEAVNLYESRDPSRAARNLGLGFIGLLSSLVAMFTHFRPSSLQTSGG